MRKKSKWNLNGKLLFIQIIIITSMILGLSAITWAQHIFLVNPMEGLMVQAQLTVTSIECSPYRIDWGDGYLSTNFYLIATGTTLYGHTYESAGTYDVILLCSGSPDVTVPVTVPAGAGDTEDPIISISSPASDPYTASSSPITLSGTASDNVGVTQVTWSNNQGGSGTATGTTAWSASGITLQDGSNIITVTAHDAEGNTGTDSMTINYDLTPPTINITSPTSSPTYSASISPITLGGTASDNVGVTQVTWSNDRGGSGTATGTTAWSASGITLQSGNNIITITARDSIGNENTDSITITYDIQPPLIVITTPTSNTTFSTSFSSITLGGTASDNVGVTQVTWSNDRGDSGMAIGTTSWTASGITLQPGDNVITLTAYDAETNQGTDTITVSYDSTAPAVTITIPTSSPTYAASVSPVILSGTASDNISVTQVTWSNNRGGSGTATGTTAWSASGISLLSGDNTITITVYDAAGNHSTDAITINFTPTLEVSTLQSLYSIVPGQRAIIRINYTATGSGTFTATSSQGILRLEDGTVLSTVTQTVSIAITNGSGSAIEDLQVEPGIIRTALGENAGRIKYARTFSYGGESSPVEITLQIVPVSAGEFTISSIEIRFDKIGMSLHESHGDTDLDSINVIQGSSSFKAVALITYNGQGLLRAMWKVDGQILNFVTLQLSPGTGEIRIETPRIPGLPTYEIGRHEVELEIIDPAPLFDEPVAFYYVSPGTEIETIQLHSPANDEHISLGSGILDQPRFSWQGIGPEYTYRFELFLVPGWRDILAEDILASKAKEIENADHLIFPVIKSETSSEFYILSLRDIERLQKGIPYLWHVAVYQEGKLVASSLHRSVYFSDPPPEAGEIIFEYLDVIELPGGPSSLFKPFEAKNAYAEDPNKRFEIKPGRTFLIKSRIKNDTNRPKMGIYVQFLVDGVLVDQSFIASLEAGESADVEGKYTVAKDDTRSHTLELKATKGFGENVEVLASIQAYLENTKSK